MHPAPSLIFFTTTSGAGYGILFLLGAFFIADLLPLEPVTLLVAFGLAYTLVTSGLIASTFHLGNPQRAWRALSQWRSSWLSREGVLAVITYPISAGFLLSLTLPLPSGVQTTLALLTSLSSALTVIATANIYASLKTIPRWNHELVVPGYIAFGLASGACLLSPLLTAADRLHDQHLFLAIVATLACLLIKWRYWRSIDQTTAESTPETATGLGHIGTVRSLEHPHSQPNWVLREMGFQVARDHIPTLRMLCLCCITTAIGCLMLAGVMTSAAILMTSAAAILLTFGALIERWLLFAEARHVVLNYY